MPDGPLPQTFHTGDCFEAYRMLGAHPCPSGGWEFALWAPGARAAAVEGDFGGWADIPMTADSAGVWRTSCPDAREGQLYKFRITGQDGRAQEHSDPYAFGAELRPGTASKLCRVDNFSFSDEEWMARRQKNYDRPLNIYELHGGSWQRREDGGWYNYEELADRLIPYLLRQGYTHLEFLPLAEHPLDESWGYLVTGYFAPTSRYGSPAQFARLVDRCHRAGIGVLMDFVPVHFAANPDGLARLDGTELYEHPHDVGQSEWGSLNFNLYRGEVKSFLKSAAAFWLQVYHCDGLRMDAISRALYWLGDEKRGVNPGAVDFLREMNEGLHRRFPTAILAAEDSTNFPKVTAPVAYEGLGFDYKWDMGWMHDTLEYFSAPFGRRPGLYSRLIFSMNYFHRELYLLALSHDENVHGKKTILDKMYGSYREKFSQARLLYLYMYAHPGKKLNFMGNELGHFREWDEQRPLDWELLRYPAHDAFLQYMARLGALYQQHPALYREEYDPARFGWVEADQPGLGLLAFTRQGGGETLLAVFNTQNRPLEGAQLRFARPFEASLLLASEESRWDGSGAVPAGRLYCRQEGRRGERPYLLRLDLAPLSGALYLLEER